MYFDNAKVLCIAHSASKKLSWLLAVTLLPLCVAAAKEVVTASMYIKPQRCVSLIEGQMCHVTLDVNWEASETGEYCLYQTGRKEAITCWENQRQGRFEMELQTNKNVNYELRQKNNDTVLATAELSLAWVYEAEQKSRLTWRLF